MSSTGTKKQIESEYLRLIRGFSEREKPGGIGTVRFKARCTDPESVVSLAKQVLQAIDLNCHDWPVDENWAKLLPNPFVQRCAPEMTQREVEDWLAWWKEQPESEQDRIEKEKDWALSDWLYWLEPRNRQWFWWDEEVGSKELHVALEINEWPFAWGSFAWLLRGSGSEEVVSIE